MIQSTLSKKDGPFITKVSQDLLALRSSLIPLFPERTFLIDQILAALVIGQHVLVYGPYGSAKTLIAESVFQSIVGVGMNGEPPETFMIQMDSETTSDKIIGVPNLQKWQHQGQLVLEMDGYLPTAHFAVLDEIYDAIAVLRSINDMLNERELREGKTRVKIPLMTAIATTNRSPDELIELYRVLQLGAVNDRFLFVSDVNYLTGDSALDAMLDNFLMGATLDATVQFADLQRLVKLIRTTNQFPNREYARVYREVMQAFRVKLKKQGGDKILSDRRVAWLTQIVEAQALLQGRAHLYFDDIMGVALGVAQGEGDPLYAMFHDVAAPIIEKAKKEHDEQVDQAVVVQLDDMEQKLNEIRSTIDSPGWPQNPKAIGEALAQVKKIEQALQGIRPQLTHNEQRRTDLLGTSTELRATIVERAS